MELELFNLSTSTLKFTNLSGLSLFLRSVRDSLERSPISLSEVKVEMVDDEVGVVVVIEGVDVCNPVDVPPSESCLKFFRLSVLDSRIASPPPATSGGIGGSSLSFFAEFNDDSDELLWNVAMMQNKRRHALQNIESTLRVAGCGLGEGIGALGSLLVFYLL